MTLDASKAQVAVSGGVLKGLTSATAPTGTASVTTGFTDGGYLSDEGVDIEMPDTGDANPIKAWQGGTTVRTIRTPTEDNPTWHFTFIETNLTAVETYFGVTVTQTVTEGSFAFVATANRPYNSYIIDVIDGVELQRDYVPKGIVTSVGAQKASNGDVTGYEVTIEGELDTVKGYNFKRWATRLKS